MITEWLVSVGTGFASWLASVMPTWDPPSWVATSVTGISGFLGSVSGIGAWIPFGVVFAVTGSLVTAYGVFFVVKLIRAIVSYLPFFGGAG